MKTYILVAVLGLAGVVLVVTLFISNKPKQTTNTQAETANKSVPHDGVAPKELPSNVPMYPNAVLNNSTEVIDEGERNVTLTLITSDSVPDVITWYKGALSSDGWSVTDDRNVGGYTLLKGENENLTVFMQSAEGEGGETVITERIRIR